MEQNVSWNIEDQTSYLEELKTVLKDYLPTLNRWYSGRKSSVIGYHIGKSNPGDPGSIPVRFHSLFLSRESVSIFYQKG